MSGHCAHRAAARRRTRAASSAISRLLRLAADLREEQAALDVTAALMENAPSLLAEDPVIEQVEVLARS